MDPSSFFPIISGMLGGAASAGLFKGPIQTVEDWWYVNFGHTSSEKAEMMRVKQSLNVEAYRDSLLEEISKVNPENLKEPELKILGPALEASKYYIEDEELRILFAKLIAASMDKSKEKIVHPSYVEIIKQLTPLDAENVFFINMGEDKNKPLASILIKYSIGGFDYFASDLFLSNIKNSDQTILRPSLNNLERLGLINITYDTYMLKEGLYDRFEELQEFKEASEFIDRKNNEYSSFKNNWSYSQEERDKIPTLTGPELKKGLVKLTPFGINFCATCL